MTFHKYKLNGLKSIYIKYNAEYVLTTFCSFIPQTAFALNITHLKTITRCDL